FERARRADKDHEIERVGAQLRAMMPWSEEGKKRGSGEAGTQGSGDAGKRDRNGSPEPSGVRPRKAALS
ncbi:MAG: hypothetical protein M3Q75_13110, partial [Gemmatimonadota bacterium]|nr:hypothetical protein [Gemmatimonadota bacterium]